MRNIIWESILITDKIVEKNTISKNIDHNNWYLIGNVYLSNNVKHRVVKTGNSARVEPASSSTIIGVARVCIAFIEYHRGHIMCFEKYAKRVKYARRAHTCASSYDITA